MNHLECVLSARREIQSLFETSYLVPWNEIVRNRRGSLYTDPGTSLTVIEVRKGSDVESSIINRVIKNWEEISGRLVQNGLLNYERSNGIAWNFRIASELGHFPDSFHFCVSGNEQIGIQGVMLWGENDREVHLNFLMTNPVNVISPVSDANLRVKYIGTTLIRYLQRFCILSNRPKIVLNSSDARSDISYLKNGFIPDIDEDGRDGGPMTWQVRQPSLKNLNPLAHNDS